MIWLVAYVAFATYAAGLLAWCLHHHRPWAAAGIALSLGGFQLGVTDTINPLLGLTIALTGLGCIAYDVTHTLLPRTITVPVLQRRQREHA